MLLQPGSSRCEIAYITASMVGAQERRKDDTNVFFEGLNEGREGPNDPDLSGHPSDQYSMCWEHGSSVGNIVHQEQRTK